MSWELDYDFGDERVGPDAPARVREPPPMVHVPTFFDGCRDNNSAIAKVVDLLQQPYAYERDGLDELYRRVSLALILLLANQGGLGPPSA